jgi:hypothetical protein
VISTPRPSYGRTYYRMHNVGTPLPAIRSRVFEAHEPFPIERPGALGVIETICAHENHGVLLQCGGVLWTFRDGSTGFTRAYQVTETLRDLLAHRRVVLRTIAINQFIPFDCSEHTLTLPRTYEQNGQEVISVMERRIDETIGSWTKESVSCWEAGTNFNSSDERKAEFYLWTAVRMRSFVEFYCLCIGVASDKNWALTLPLIVDGLYKRPLSDSSMKRYPGHLLDRLTLALGIDLVGYGHREQSSWPRFDQLFTMAVFCEFEKEIVPILKTELGRATFTDGTGFDSVKIRPKYPYFKTYSAQMRVCFKWLIRIFLFHRSFLLCNTGFSEHRGWAFLVPGVFDRVDVHTNEISEFGDLFLDIRSQSY